MEDLIKVLMASTIGGLTSAFLLKTWITARITHSIKNEYDRQLEVYKRELDRKQKIELVSELLAEWIKYSSYEVMPKDHRTKLNNLSFQACLWLPSDLAKELSKALQLRPEAKTIFEILLLARKLLLDDETLPLDLTTYWGIEFETNGALKTPNHTQSITPSKP
ncbi:hypothetical protein [Methylophilus sp. OH31]|uniref:hypothetical protein n=1 Tax=Methylophilus sp. OH31 TaxID=1387312 RepID=UPI0011DCB73D|nr:hypothetical protein [Methylophilus sp. OH31]